MHIEPKRVITDNILVECDVNVVSGNMHAIVWLCVNDTEMASVASDDSRDWSRVVLVNALGRERQAARRTNDMQHELICAVIQILGVPL